MKSSPDIASPISLNGDGGQGVIIVLSALTPASFADLDHLWDELAANIHIGKSPPLIHALETGAALLQRIPVLRAGDSWRIWSSGSVQMGFTHEYVDKSLKSASLHRSSQLDRHRDGRQPAMGIQRRFRAVQVRRRFLAACAR